MRPRSKRRSAKPPPRLWERLRADPLRAPEHVALAASEYHGPAAAAWADRRRRVYGDRPARRSRRWRAAVMSTWPSIEGAATGVGGFITLVPDLVGLAWIESRLVFFIAAAYGFDPHRPDAPGRAAGPQRALRHPVEARAALDGMGVSMAEAWVGGRSSPRDEAIALELAKMVGKTAGKKFAGRLIPGFAIAFNAVANRRDTNALAKRAIKFYGGY